MRWKLSASRRALVLVGSLQFAVLPLSSPAQDLKPSVPSLAAECSASDNNQVAITVEVKDKSGSPVTGLEASDFQLFDNKQPQKIRTFRAVDGDHPAAIPLRIRFIIDAVNADAVLVGQERDGVSAFLKQNSGKLDYPTSIWLLENDGLRRIAGPSQDGMALSDALTNAQPLLRVLDRSAGVWGAVERTGQATRLLKEIVSPESRTPGRKLEFFFSPGWPMLFNFEPDNRTFLFNDIVTISNGLRESCTSLYALLPGFGTDNYDSFLKGVTKAADAQYQDLSLQVLSEHSGGQVIVAGNDVKAEINNALRGASAWYDLTFERAPGGRATEYHEIRIAVDRSRVRIRTSAGYYVKGP